MTRFRIRHETLYDYCAPVTLCHNVAHLRPRPGPHQNCTAAQIVVQPPPAVMTERADYFGNPANYFTIQDAHTTLKLAADHQVTVAPPTPPVASATASWELLRAGLPLAAREYVAGSRYAPAGDPFRDYARLSFAPGRPVLDAAVELTHRIFTDFEYDPSATTVATPVAEVARLRRGVCQDFAHFQISCLRSLGLAARYVSGYLSTVPPPGMPRLIGCDATHAWASIYCGEAGWVDLDPTNDVIPGERHVLLAWGRDYDDVAPLKGVILGGGAHMVRVSVDVEPIGEMADAVPDPNQKL